MMDPHRVNGIIQGALKKGVEEAENTFGGRLVARALHPGDIPPTGTTQRLWFETTATTTDTFVTGAIGDGTNTNDDTVIVLYGARWIFSERHNTNGDRSPFRPPVSYVRLTVGGTRVAEWDLTSIFLATNTQGGGSSGTSDLAATYKTPVGITESPVIVKSRTALQVQYYELCTAATDFSIQILGHVIEQAGAGDALNP